MARRRTTRAVGAVVAVVALTAGGVWAYDAVREQVEPLLTDAGCTATVRGRTVELDAEQAENAALIAAISVSRGLPARAATIALATAYQESKIYNLDVGDRDSLGLFQQRPSQGWGTRDEVTDPVYATNAFYDALVRVEGYEQLAVTVAAQEVQRSGFPEAYAAHEADARVLASALTGNSAHAFTCEVFTDRQDDAPLPQQVRGRVRTEVTAMFAARVVVRAGGALEIATGGRGAAGRARGWAVAHYLVAQAGRLGISAVTYDGRMWSVARSGDGWRPATDAPARRVTVDVA